MGSDKKTFKLQKKLDKYKKSYKNFLDQNNSLKTAEMLLNIGETYEKLNEYDKALDNYFIALNLYREEGDLNGESQSLIYMGNLSQKEKDYSEARRYYEDSLKIFKETKDFEMQKSVSKMIYRCYLKEGRLDDAMNTLQNINNLPIKTLDFGQQSLKIEMLKNELRHIRPFTILILLFYVFIILMAELITYFYSPSWGIFLQTVLIIFLIIQSTLTKSIKLSYLLQALILIPLIRIMGLTIPVAEIEPIYWLFILTIPILSACYLVMRSQNITKKRAGLIKGNLAIQLGIGISGIAIGFLEFLILEPSPLITSLNLLNLIFGSLILLISTGLTEELIFRGIIQKNAEDILGSFGAIIFTSILFTSQQIGWSSFPHLILVFLVSIFYGYIFIKTRSIIGVIISHGLSNILLFLILPFIF